MIYRFWPAGACHLILLLLSVPEIVSSQAETGVQQTVAEQLLVRLMRAVSLSRRGYQPQRVLNRMRHAPLYGQALRELSAYLRRERSSLHQRAINAEYLERTVFFAAASGHRNVLELLIEAGADVRRRNREGETLLHIAAFRGHSGIVLDLLRRESPVNRATCCGETPLHVASMRGHSEIVRMLIENRAALEARDMLLMTPLHRAAAHGHVEIARLLIEAGSRINVSSSTGMTPLHSASNSGQVHVIQYLLSSGADFSARNSLGLTPLDCASRRGHLDVVKLLLGYDIDNQMASLEGFLPLTYAAVWRQHHIVDYFISIDVFIDENQKGVLRRFYPGFKRKLRARRFVIVRGVDGATHEVLPEDILRLLVGFVVSCQN